MRLNIRKAKKPREGKELHSCKMCEKDILIGELNMEIQGFNAAVGKNFSNYYHEDCAHTWLDNRFNKRDRKTLKREPKPMQNTKTEHKEVSPELLARRRRVLEYFNRDRVKLQRYYESGDTEQISRKLVLVASRIDELADIGLEFKLNKLSDLILKHDKRTLQQMASTDDWRKRADVLRESAQAWAGKSSHPDQA